MMLTSAPINDKKAAKLGLVDAVVPSDKLLAAARAMAAEIAAGTKPRNFTLYRWSPQCLSHTSVMSLRFSLV